ncbi:MAG: hypothetical protein PHH85_13350 [Candidatus Methanoperedens sp.]|nr:hypothetical protein [Candidatus Methanoperedens sp.]
MNKSVCVVLSLLILSIIGGVAQSQTVGMEQRAVPLDQTFDAQNFTKLEISPRYGNLQLQPGESKELTVTIKNKEKKPITVSPHVEVPPYGEYVMEKEWVTVTPASSEIPAGGSQNFVIKAAIPADASVGYYNAMVAFTDETIPTPYPQPFPNYVHTFSLSVNVWTPPKVQIQKPYIQDQLEAGKEYDYKIKLKNTGDKAIAINPKISQQDQMYGPYGAVESAFTDDALEITSPKEIASGASVEVNVHVKVPADAKGSYRGAIDLGIDDPSIARNEWADLVRLELGVWKQPAEPFVKTFVTQEASPVTIEVSSNLFEGIYKYLAAGGAGTKNAKEPSFTVTLTGSENNAIPLNKTKTMIKGGVSLGGTGMFPPWESDSEGIYTEMGTQYVETYTADVPAGNLKLGIMPWNTQQFEYTITLGNK